MQNLKVATVQPNQLWEDKRGNFENYERLLTDLKEVDLIVLPEMFQTGFTMNSETLAEEISGESLTWLKKIATEKNAAVYASLIIKENNEFYNRGVFVLPNHEVHTYNKRHLFGMAGEDQHFKAGNSKTIVEYKGWKINLQVCYDLRFPENARNRMVDGVPEYDALIYVANWPERRINHWNNLLIARAIENQSFVIGVNRVGVDAQQLNYNGCSAVINPMGEIISNHSKNVESVEYTVLEIDILNEVRNKLPFLKDVVF